MLDRKLSRRHLIRAGLYGTIAAVVAACTKAVSSASPITPSPASPPPAGASAFPSAAAATIVPVSPAASAAITAKRGGTLVVAQNADTASLDPHTQASQQNREFGYKVYEPLVGVDAKFNPFGVLAESWDVTGPTTYVFHLRHGVLFHNGREMDSGDVQYTFQRINDTKVGSYLRGQAGLVTTVATPDKYTAEITLAAPSSGFIPCLFNKAIVPREVATMPPDYLKSNVIGTGPFMLQSWQPNTRQQLVRNPNYWQSGLPYLDGMDIRIVPNEDTILAGLKSGSFDYYRLGDNRKYASLEAVPNLTLSRIGSAGPHRFNLNFRRKEFQDPRVVQALSLALDRPGMLTAVTAGLGTAPCGPTSPAHAAYYVPATQLPVAGLGQDIAQAKSLLQAAGLGSGFHVKIINDNTFLAMDTAAQLAQANWAEIGVTSTIVQQEDAVWVDSRVSTFDYDISTNLEYNMIHPSQYFSSVVYSKGVEAQWEKFDSTTSSYSAALDKQFEAVEQLTDPTAIADGYKNLEIATIPSMVELWLFSKDFVDILQNYVMGFEAHPTVWYGLNKCWLNK